MLGQGVTLTFDVVTGAGDTTLATSSMGPPPPSGFRLGSPPVYYDISTAATFTGSVEVCINYDGSSFTGAVEKTLRLMHQETAWVDKTSSLDTGADVICAQITSFSLFLPVELIPDEDFDGDGCRNIAELDVSAASEETGGLRDPFNPWDFYDVWTHPSGDPEGWERSKVINIFDILGVIKRFGSGSVLSKQDALDAALIAPTDDSSYHPAFDRGPIIGANNWDRAPPDGAINIVDDILGVAFQFGHNCT